ncbi:MAG: phage major capsid protein, partial [Deltaproteobacteria bacterium]|nr:phage major capsid protein [Deltaproteobacteria bacterium]
HLQELMGDFYITDMTKATSDAIDAAHRKSYRILQRLIQRAESEKRDLTPEELAEYQSVERYGTDLAEERDRRDLKIMNEPASHGRAIHKNYTPDGQALAKHRSGPEWRNVFYGGRRTSLDKGGFNSFDEYLGVIASGRFDDRIRTEFAASDLSFMGEQRSMSGTTGSAGGFSVPEIWSSEIWDSAIEDSVCVDGLRTFPMESDILNIPAWSSSDHTSGAVGAFEGQWLGELGTATRVTPTMRLITLRSCKLAVYIQASQEVYDDSTSISRQIEPTMKKSLAFTLDEAIIRGNGVSKPTGILNASSRIQATRATASQIGWADIRTMYGRLHPAYLKGARWLMSPDAFTQILGMESTAGQLLYMPNLDVSGNTPGSLLGVPIYISEKCSALGTEGDIILCNLSAYAFGLRKTFTFDKSNVPGWLSHAIDFRLIIRCDGIPLMADPITPAGGGDTLSWAVTLSA